MTKSGEFKVTFKAPEISRFFMGVDRLNFKIFSYFFENFNGATFADYKRLANFFETRSQITKAVMDK